MHHTCKLIIPANYINLIAVPEAQGSLILLSKESDSLYFKWTEPIVPNGTIIEYMIVYEYYERVCRGYGNKISATKTITTYSKQDISDAASNTSFVLDKLYPFWNYTITIKARTSKGYEPASHHGTYITRETGKSMSFSASIDNIFFLKFPKF